MKELGAPDCLRAAAFRFRFAGAQFAPTNDDWADYMGGAKDPQLRNKLRTKLAPLLKKVY